MARLTSGDHVLLENFLGCVLDRYKDGHKTKDEAIGELAHLVVAVSLADGDDWRAYMMSAIVIQS